MMMRQYLPVLLTFALFTGLAVSAQAQGDRPSPPATAKGMIGDAEVVINYSQPGVKGREIWGGLVPYGKVWRTGANEATTFETSAEINFGGKTLPAGKYALFTIPEKDKWTFIFNSVPDQWGAYSYDKSKDVLRVTAKPKDSGKMMERMTFKIENGEVQLWWDKLMVSIAGTAGS